MARQKKSLLEYVIVVASKLPWWAGVALALISYLLLQIIASRPPLPEAGPGQMGAFQVRSLYTTLAMLGQFVLPFAFGLGALMSAINLLRQISYPRFEVTRQIEETPSSEGSGIPAPESGIAATILEKRHCPDCGTELVLQKFRSGPKRGEQFLACRPCQKGWALGQECYVTTWT